MIEFDNRTTLNIDENLLNEISSLYTNKDIELIATNNQEIKQINLEQRNIDSATDVLSFPYEDMPLSPLGSIVISADYVEQKANELNHSTQDEFTLLFCHGLLHLLGFDHETDNGEMRLEEEKIITQFKLPTSLIVRTQT